MGGRFFGLENTGGAFFGFGVGFAATASTAGVSGTTARVVLGADSFDTSWARASPLTNAKMPQSPHRVQNAVEGAIGLAEDGDVRVTTCLRLRDSWQTPKCEPAEYIGSAAHQAVNEFAGKSGTADGMPSSSGRIGKF